MRATAEYERKLDAPVGFHLPPLGGRPLKRRAFTSVYYDVPGGSLADAGITLRRRTEHGRGVWQLELPSEDGRLEVEAEGGRRPPKELLPLLRTHLRHGPLERVAELRTRRHRERVSRNGSAAEVTLDEVAVIEQKHVRERFIEVEVELRSGDPKYADAVARRIARAGAHRGDETPKLFRVLGREEEDEPDAPLDQLRALLRRQLCEIQAHDPGTRLGKDPESLHQMRVAVRRSRALLRSARALAAGDRSELEADLKELGAALGAVRDLDVLLARLREEAADLEPADRREAATLLRALVRQRTRARRRLLDVLDSEEYLALLDRFAATIDQLQPAEEELSLDDLAARPARKLRKFAKALPDDPTSDELHELRKLDKHGRYAAELAGQDKVARRAKQLQDVLGDHQDAVVAEERLRELAGRAAPSRALAAGRLIERERVRRQEARAKWEKAWDKLRREL